MKIYNLVSNFTIICEKNKTKQKQFKFHIASHLNQSVWKWARGDEKTGKQEGRRERGTEKIRRMDLSPPPSSTKISGNVTARQLSP